MKIRTDHYSVCYELGLEVREQFVKVSRPRCGRMRGGALETKRSSSEVALVTRHDMALARSRACKLDL